MDVSAWWVVGAFVVGGYAGALLVALITMAANDGQNGSSDVGGGGVAANGRWGL